MKKAKIKFIDYLPDFFRSEEDNLYQFMGPFEELFEELRVSVEGKEYLTELIGKEEDNILLVKAFAIDPLDIIGQENICSFKDGTDTDIIKIELPDENDAPAKVQVDKWFATRLEVGDQLAIYTGNGLSDLFDPARRTLVLNEDRTQLLSHKEYKYSPSGSDYQRIKYLASWISIPMREDKPFEWNREFLKNAIPLWNDRYTVQGMESLLMEWLKGDVEDPKYVHRPVLVTDLTSKNNRFYHIFCLDKKNPPILGVNTVLGEGPPNFFLVDIIVNSREAELRSMEKLMELFRAIRFFIDSEKPAHTHYQLRIRNSTLQLTPSKEEWLPDEVYASAGETTLLWRDAWVYNGY